VTSIANAVELETSPNSYYVYYSWKKLMRKYRFSIFWLSRKISLFSQ